MKRKNIHETFLLCYIFIMLDIYKLGNDVLREPCARVSKFDNALAMLTDAMFETMIEADGVGLAAPQVGISQRFFVVDTRREGERIAFFNPEIIETSGSQTGDEGCLSLPGMSGTVTRPNYVKVKAFDENMEEITLEGTELLARAICHETDHLHGKMYTELVEGELRRTNYEEDEEE